MFLVYLSQRLHAPFFYTCLIVQWLFLGKSSWIAHGTLWCIQWREVTPSYLLCWVVDIECNVSILFFDLPIYLPLSKQSNWYILGWLSGSSFGFFWHKMPWKFLPDVKVKSLFTFLNFFPNFWPNMSYPLDFFWVVVTATPIVFLFDIIVFY